MVLNQNAKKQIITTKKMMKVFFISHIQLVYSWHFQNPNLMWIWNSMKHIGRHWSEKIKVLAICY